jgi:hypothetical protein
VEEQSELGRAFYRWGRVTSGRVGGVGSQWPGTREAVANGEALADVGAVQGSDVGWGTSAEAREERGSSGRGSCTCARSRFRVWGRWVHVGLWPGRSWREKEGPGWCLWWPRAGPEVLHQVVPKEDGPFM